MIFEQITSASNQKVKRLQALQRKARLRKKEQCFVLEGDRLFRDAPAGYIREIYVTPDYFARNEDVLRARIAEIQSSEQQEKLKAEGYGPVCAVLAPEIFGKVCDTQTPQGVMCVAQMPSYVREDLMGERAPFLMLLENIQDPGNLGTIFRTAEAAGVTGIIMSSDTADLFNPKTVRATMSSVFRMPFLYTDDLTGEIALLREKSVAVYAAHLGADRVYDEYDYTTGCAFLIGNEGNGLTEEASDAASHRLLIPMQGKIESLNAAMAAGILMYEASGQRRHELT